MEPANISNTHIGSNQTGNPDTAADIHAKGYVTKMIQHLESETVSSNVSTRTVFGDDDMERYSELTNISEVSEESTFPKDAYNLIYLIVLLNGVGCLLPWNLFITIASEYYSGYKMKNVSYYNQSIPVLVDTTLSKSFLNYMTICAQMPCLMLNLINIFVQIRGGLGLRIASAMILIMSLLVFTMSFIYIDTWNWTTLFYIITMVTVFLLNAANGVYQNSMFGLLADLPSKYTNAFIVGNNLCGILVTVMHMVAFIAARGQTPQLAALIYFSTALVVVVACLFSFLSLRKMPFYQYYLEKAGKGADEQNIVRRTREDYKATFSQGWRQFLNVYIIFAVSLTIFPNMMVEVSDRSGKEATYDFLLSEELFIPVTTFLVFNVFAFLGSFVAGKVRAVSPSKLWIPVVLRLLLIPFFFFCNYKYDSRLWPEFFTNTWAFIAGGIVLSSTSGYLSSLGMMYSSLVVEESRRAIAGMMAGFSLIFGIVTGLLLNLAISHLVVSIGPGEARSVPL